MTKAQIGTVIAGTHKPEDLIPAFADELDSLRNHYETVMLPCAVEDMSAETQSEWVDALMEEIGTYAPPYCYFGAHPGDGADFGFWIDREAIMELPRVDDPSDVDGMDGEACVFVNDHGNVTVYEDGKPVLEFV